MQTDDHFSNRTPSPWMKVDHEGKLDCFEKISNEDKTRLAKEALVDTWSASGSEFPVHRFLTWLRWVKSDHPHAILWWHWLDEHPDPDIPGRDEYISKLWEKINVPNVTQERVMKETAWSFYERHFFNWFLTRYNIVDARRVFKQNGLRQYDHILLSASTLGIVFWFFGFSCRTGCEWFIAAGLIALVFFLGKYSTGIAWSYYLQSLIPRMAVTTGIGYLFLFSASGLVVAIHNNQLSLIGQIAISIALVISVFVYMVQVIQRRVVPRLSFRRACGRAFHLLCLGSGYSAIGLLVSAPILFSELFDERIVTKPPDEPVRLLVTAAIALAIGVVSQLVWDDKPVTEPF